MRLVQIVQHRGMPIEHALGDVLRELQILAEAVAIVVVRDILAPINQRGLGLAGLLAVIIGVDHLLAAVDLDHRGDEGDHLVADRANEGRVLHRKAVGEFDQHFRPARLGRVDAAGDPVDRFGRLDDLRRLFRIGAARVAEQRELRLVVVEQCERRLIGDGDDDLLAPFLGSAEGHVLHARRGAG